MSGLPMGIPRYCELPVLLTRFTRRAYTNGDGCRKKFKSKILGLPLASGGLINVVRCGGKHLHYFVATLYLPNLSESAEFYRRYHQRTFRFSSLFTRTQCRISNIRLRLSYVYEGDRYGQCWPGKHEVSWSSQSCDNRTVTMLL